MPLIQLGSIGAVGNNSITKVEAYNGSTQTLWDGNAKSGVEMPAGKAWKLRIETSLYGEANGWAACVTVVASGVPSSYAKQSLTYRFEFGGNTTKAFIFNMGTMPSSSVTISKVKLWKIEDYVQGAPGEGSW